MKSIVKWPLITGGIIFVAGPLLGVGGTLLGMAFTFNTLSTSESPSAEPVAAGISSSLGTTMIGISLGFLGLGLLLFALVAYVVTRDKNLSNKAINTTA